MKLPPLLLLPLTLLLPFLATTTTTPTPTPPTCIASLDVYDTPATASTGITDLGFKLLKELQGQGNTLISPYSIWSVLAMVLVGAEGRTLTEMLPVLGLNEKKGILSLWNKLDQSLLNIAKDDPKVSIDLANRVYMMKGFSLRNCKHELSNLTVPIDFIQKQQASDTINSFVNTSTRGLIPKIVEPSLLSEDTRMILINAVYFKGEWKNQFPTDETSKQPFYVTPNAKSVLVDMMFGRRMYVKNGMSTDLKAQVLQLPYSKDHVSMSILLPQEDGESGFQSTLRALSSTTFWNAISTLGKSNVDVHMPKFEIESKFADEMKTALRTLGINDLFDLSADLSSFADQLYVKFIIHKTLMRVNERGTEAGAVTGAGIHLTSLPPSIVLNRPFLFVLHTKDTILFIGSYKQP